MKRKIKFRIWNGEQMIIPDKIDNHKGIALWYENSIPNYSEDLMQFTGLLDKNNKEIYENDILRCNFQENEIGVITWQEHGFWIKQKSGSMTLPNKENREIIGNIYMNPELLEDIKLTKKTKEAIDESRKITKKSDLIKHKKDLVENIEKIADEIEKNLKRSKISTIFIPQLKDITKKDFDRLKASGVLWEIYPDAPDTYEEIEK